MKAAPQTLTDLLRQRAEMLSDAIAYRFLDLESGASSVQEWTYADIDRRARSLAVHLQERVEPGSRALLLYGSSLEFVAAFMGCMYAGVIAVPAFPPHSARLQRAMGRLCHILDDCDAQIVLSTAQFVERRDAVVEAAPELGALQWLATDVADLTAADGWRRADISADSVAFLQYTSGSTGNAKGVVNLHRNVLDNERVIAEGFRTEFGVHVLGWLPLFHDMGLIGNVLHPMYMGGTCTLMSPAAFLKRPFNWLAAISRYRGVVSGGPNFAFDLCVSRIPPEERVGLDLSSWAVAYNGSEPVRKETMDAFSDAFEGTGFRRDAFLPCYGLAEATLYVTSAGRGGYRHKMLRGDALAQNIVVEAQDGERGHAYVSCGIVPSQHEVVIVDPKTEVKSPDQVVGEIWVRGPSIAAGYWNNAEQTERTFPSRMTEAGPARFMRTGDLGFLADGQLFITARMKDLIILRGRNLYPQDIEVTVLHAHQAVRTAGVAAFSTPVDGRDQLAILAETSIRREGETTREVIEAIRSAVADEHGAFAHTITLTLPNRIPRTSSGKIQRHACAEGIASGTIPVIARFTAEQADAGSALGSGDGALPALDLEAVPEGDRLDAVRELLQGQIASAVGVVDAPPGASLTGLGLDSLMMIEIQARLERALGVSLPVAFLAEMPTIEAVCEALVREWHARDATEGHPIVPALLQSKAPLASGQMRLFLLEQLAGGAPVYHLHFGIRLEGAIDSDRLQQAFRTLENRHAALRTRICMCDGVPVQLIEPNLANEFATRDISDVDDQGQDGIVRQLAREQAERPFVLEQGQLTRALLVKLAPERHVFLIAQHHTISDGWSAKRLLSDLAAIYGALSEDRQLPGYAGMEFTDYVRWEADQLARDTRGRAFWLRQVSGAPRLDLPVEIWPPPQRSYRGGRVEFEFPSAARKRLAEIAQNENCTLFVALLSVYAMLLQRYSGQQEFMIGSVVANRRSEVQEVCGFFANTIAFRCDLSGSLRFHQLLSRTGAMVRETLRFSSYPFAEIARLAGGNRYGDENPVFQACFVFESGGDHRLRVANSTWSPVFWSPDGATEGTAKFDLSLSMIETSVGIRASFEYSSDRLSGALVRRMAAGFLRLLDEVTSRPEAVADRIDAISADELRLLDAWNETAADVPVATCFHRLFERRALLCAAAEAVSTADQRLTYGQLNAAANRLARRLRRAGAGPDRLVALLMPRGLWLVAAVLGVFKAGAAYVPIDPDYPQARREQILDQSGAAWLVITRDLAAELQVAGASTTRQVMHVEDLVAEGESADDLQDVEVTSQNLAYVIYTSGSTGMPKGAMVTHAGMVNHLYAKLRELELKAGDVVAQNASQCFDISVWQCLAALLVGGRTHVIDTETAGEPLKLFRAAMRAGITVLEIVPSLLSSALEQNAPFELGPLRWLLLTGEALTPELARRWLGRHPVPIINAYGPTECSDDVAHHVINDVDSATGAYTPIGRAIVNTRLYVLDKAGMRSPIGVPGELYVGGVGVGRGYWKDPVRTAERFEPDPFADVPGSRLYRTGDRVKVLSSGELVFLGRDDEQVKIRGFRIELGEVQAALATHPDVANAVVMVRPHGETGEVRLVAYVQLSRSVSPSGLRDYVRDRLPDYMVPSAFVELDRMPLTPNGKIDRQALPEPGGADWEKEHGYVAPRNPVEEMVAAIWAEVLALGRIGIEDDFFERGGHSLLATRAMSRVRSNLGVELPLRKLFELRTVAGVAGEIERLLRQPEGTAASPPLRRRERSGDLPLSFAQQRLWFLEELAPGEATYNISGCVRIEGELQIEALGKAFNEIVRRHEALRTTFVGGEEPLQVIALTQTLRLQEADFSGLEGSEAAGAVERWLQQEASRPFDLEHGPLIRVSVVRLGPQEHVLAVSMHHIVSDGWSLGVLMREASELYGAYLAGADTALPELEIQYADYSLWQREWLQGEVLERQLGYWRRELDGVPTTLDLPLDRARPLVASQRGRQHAIRLEAELGQQLRQLGRVHGATLYMVLLAGFYGLLGRYSGQEQLLVGSPIAGRTRRETEGLIGFFVNTLVLRGDLRGRPSFEELLRRVKETTLGAFANQDIPFEKLVEVLSPARDASRTPLFQVMFILQNAPGGRLQLGSAHLQPLALETGTAKFELTLSLEEQADGSLEGYWEYNSELFEAATIARMAEHYVRLLAAAVTSPQHPVALLEMLSEPERRQLAAWNDTRYSYPEVCLHHLFEQQAEKTPDAIAVAGSQAQLSYIDLNSQANRWARFLQARHVGPESRVAIVMDLCPEAIVAVLAVLKSGGAYVPVDSQFPRERIDDILEQSGANVVLTTMSSKERAGCTVDTIVMDGLADLAGSEPATNLPELATVANAAYVIFTSGSTGRPKGVVVEHRQALGYFHGIVRRLGLRSGSNYAMVQPLAVDSCNTVLIPWMCLGGTLHVLSRSEALDPAAVASYFRQQRMDVLKIAPSHLTGWLDAAAPDELLPHGDLVLGGEGSRWDWLRDMVLPRMPAGARVHIHYGPTETTVGVLTEHVKKPSVKSRGPLAPLGKPLSNVTCHVVSPELMALPTGVPGELMIGGGAVARGYLDRPDLTAERFLPDPFSIAPGARLYRSGDLVRRLPDGAIEFLGRIDHQIKIRGFRVELGEIESVLLRHPRVRRAAALARETGDGEKQLAAYVLVDRSAGEFDPGSLRELLSRTLPNYMIPGSIVVLDAWPTTAQGKLDLKSLQQIPVQAPDAVAAAPPRNRTEAQLAALWAQLLKTPSIGIHDNFFERGGHSLRLMRMLTLVQKRLHRLVQPTRFLEKPTIAHLAELLAGDDGARLAGPLITLEAGGHCPRFVCVHPIGGQVACYAQLAVALGNNRPFHAIQAGAFASAGTIEEIAEIYVAELRRAFGGGDICLGGWSFGGLIAFEMARQLAARGEPALALVLLDSYPPQIGRESEAEVPALTLTERFAADLAQTIGLNIATEQLSFRALDPELQRSRLIQILGDEGLIASSGEFDHLLARFSRHTVAADLYAVRQIDQPIDLFVAAEGAGRNLLAERWSKWTTADVRVRLVEGDHYSMLRAPHVTGLAAALSACLPAVPWSAFASELRMEGAT
ncbi:non-ribosomal peptide synthetase [Bradyrhizobium sp. 188]|uniref:non-ribosomal peptide synthetase n=1 Tax=Bradyrhizobium sp. 188 TaxID=2782656 RepID=UPI001FFA055E|nr:non-ribosomal peptide synthetase [Bradyrhizobium sp. 188]MCK1502136.1 amino acid adenylation domain-containing protein [Bradyrhizobium sp. 188]